PDMCFNVNRAGRVDELNSSAKIKLDLTWKDGDNHNFREIVDETFKEITSEEIEKCKRSFKSKISESKLTSGKNSFDVELLIAPYFHQPESENEYLIILARDITGSRKKELDLLRFYNIAEKTLLDRKSTRLNSSHVKIS